MSCVFYNRLDGKSGIVPMDRFHVFEFSTRFAVHIREFYFEGYLDGRSQLDYRQRYALVAVKKVLESAARPPSSSEKRQLCPRVRGIRDVVAEERQTQEGVATVGQRP